MNATSVGKKRGRNSPRVKPTLTSPPPCEEEDYEEEEVEDRYTLDGLGNNWW